MNCQFWRLRGYLERDPYPFPSFTAGSSQGDAAMTPLRKQPAEEMGGDGHRAAPDSECNLI